MTTTARPESDPSRQARPVRIPTPAPPSAVSAQGAWAVVVLTVVVAIALWVRQHGLQDLGATPAQLWTSVGRVTGLVSADMLLIQVILMARIPALERWWGQDTLARTHRLVGLWSFWLMVAHVLTITVGYGGTARKGFLGELWNLVVTYPGMLLATAGTLALVMVVATSIRAARKRLRYESWHLIHLYAYLGVFLAMPHQLWTGTDLTGSPLATAYWWSLYVVALAAVLVWRVGMPLRRTVVHRLRVASVVPEGHGVVSVYLTGRHLDRLPVRAGQFLMWRFLDGPGWTRANPYSLSAVPRTDWLRITVKDLGDGSRRLASLRPGTRVAVEGPYGAVTAHKRRRRKVLLVAAGVGVTTIRALLEDLPFKPGDVTVLYRVSKRQGATFADELTALAHERGANLVFLEGPRGRGRDSFLPGHISNKLDDVRALHRMVPDLPSHDAFVCGPPDWMAAVRRALEAGGLAPEHIHAEEFAW